MDEWEALWKKEREAIVKRIKDNKWGLQPDGKTVLGPEGFTDRSQQVPGRLEQHRGPHRHRDQARLGRAASGTQADRRLHQPGDVGDLRLLRRQGPVHRLDWARTASQPGHQGRRLRPRPHRSRIVDELIDSEKVFDVWTQGSPSTLKTYDKLNQRCIPHLFNSTGPPGVG